MTKQLEMTDARLHMVRQYTQCTGTVRIIAPSPNKGKWALGLLDKLEFVIKTSSTKTLLLHQTMVCQNFYKA